jgi:hypothetical protein
VAGRRRKLETRQWQAVEPEPHRSEDRPLLAERIRRSWEAGKCAAMWPVVGLGLVAWRAEAGRMAERRGKRKKQVPRCARNDNLRTVQLAVVEVGVIWAVRVWGWVGSGNRGCR